MKLSQFFIPTLRQAPKDAETISAQLMIRAGMVRKVVSGLYDWLPLGLRVLKKVEQIVREEMNRIGGQEVWLPHIQPKELWEETGRWQLYGKELLRLKDRKGSEFCLAPTAEEVMTDLVRQDLHSYRQLPLILYQFGSKFRDEIRPRFGVMRAREFYMKDAYSFHRDEKSAEETYIKVFDAYGKIFSRCGLNFRAVEAETGAIGGSFSHEFMVLADTGEEKIVSCVEGCGYAANVERAECLPPNPLAESSEEEKRPLEELFTPESRTVDEVSKLLKQPKEKFIKTMFYVVDKVPVVALIRGDSELNELKLLRALSAQTVEKMSEENYSRLADCAVGFAGPVGLKERCQKVDGQCQIIADHLVSSVINGISGANKKDSHLKNINIGRDFVPDRFADLRKVQDGDFCPRCGVRKIKETLRFSSGIEVGHTFKLGTKYSVAMNGSALDEFGKAHPFVMGCYGIGISRVVAAAIEQNHDSNGIIWKKELAPFKVVVIPVNFEDPQTKEWSEKIVQELNSAGIETLLDDRPDRAGVKFKDADLIGIPVRITLSERTLLSGTIELKFRENTKVIHIPKEQVLTELKKIFEPDSFFSQKIIVEKSRL